jgi:hypothetical protein
MVETFQPPFATFPGREGAILRITLTPSTTKGVARFGRSALREVT